MVQGNVGKLHQVFINILNNAIYAIAEKGIITITTAIIKGNVEVVVRDTGCGIGKEELSRLLIRFILQNLREMEPVWACRLRIQLLKNIMVFRFCFRSR